VNIDLWDVAYSPAIGKRIKITGLTGITDALLQGV